MANLKKNREKIRLPIPPVIDMDGGTFQIDLGNSTIYLEVDHST